MSVYIKSMEMPDNCLRCPLFSGNGCKATKRIFPDWLNVAVRPDACPLVEIKTPHGRLIDADALGWRDEEKKAHNETVEVVRESGCGSPTHLYYSAFYDGILTMTGKIRFAPTIIEAEGKDDG